jgi:hypothetical protein
LKSALAAAVAAARTATITPLAPTHLKLTQRHLACLRGLPWSLRPVKPSRHLKLAYLRKVLWRLRCVYMNGPLRKWKQGAVQRQVDLLRVDLRDARRMLSADSLENAAVLQQRFLHAAVIGVRVPPPPVLLFQLTQVVVLASEEAGDDPENLGWKKHLQEGSPASGPRRSGSSEPQLLHLIPVVTRANRIAARRGVCLGKVALKRLLKPLVKRAMVEAATSWQQHVSDMVERREQEEAARV